MRIIIAAMTALLVVAGVAGYLAYREYGSAILGPGPVPPAVRIAEDAIADDRLVGLMHFNVRHAVDVERAVLGEEDRQALLEPVLSRNPMITMLRAGGNDPRDDLDHVLIGLLAQGERPVVAGVLIGRFPAARMAELLRRLYLVEPKRGGDRPILVGTRQDKLTCKTSSPIAVHLAADRIAFATPGAIGPLLDRLEAESPAGTDLGEWRAFRDDKVLSLGLLRSPTEIGAMFDTPMARLASNAGKEALAPIADLYVGGRVNPLLPGIEIDMRARSLDDAMAPQAVAKYQTWRQQLTQDAGADLPSVTRLQEHLSVEAKDGALYVRLSLDRALLTDLGQLTRELIGLPFSRTGVDIPKPRPATAGQEQTIDPDKLPQFVPSIEHDDLPAYDPAAEPTFKTDAVTGPFGVRIKSLRLSNDDPDVVEIEVEAASSRIDNINGESMHRDKADPRAHLLITAVRGANGENLLREEDCGPDRNELGGALTPTTRYRHVDGKSEFVPVVTGTKAVRLKPGVRLKDIAGLEGWIRLRLPTRTEVRRLSQPLKSRVIEVPGVRVRLDDGGAGGVKYEINGRSDRVLAVRALNGSGQYLAGAGSMSTGRLLGPGKTVSKSFAGTTAEVEFVIATTEESRDYSFTVVPVRPRFGRWDHPGAYQVAVLDGRRFRRRFGRRRLPGKCDKSTSDRRLRPFRVCLESLRPAWGGTLQGRILVSAPSTPALRGNFSAIELEIDRLLVKGVPGTKDTTTSVEIRRHMMLQPGFGARHLNNGFDSYVSAKGLEGLKGKTVVGAAGRLVVRLPRRLERLTLDVTDLGDEAEHASGLRAKLVEFSDGALVLRITGQRDRLVQFVPRDSAGKPLATNAAHLEPGKEPDTRKGSVRVSGVPATRDIVFATRQDVIRYPYTLRLTR